MIFICPACSRETPRLGQRGEREVKLCERCKRDLLELDARVGPKFADREKTTFRANWRKTA